MKNHNGYRIRLTRFPPKGKESVLFVIDGANISCRLKEIPSCPKIDWIKLVNHIAGDRLVIDTWLYLPLPENIHNGFKKFQKWMEKNQITVRTIKKKLIRSKENGNFHKCNHDVMIAMDVTMMMCEGNLPDTVVFVSGDYDFIPLVFELKKRRHRVEFVSTEFGLARELKNLADEVYFIGDFLELIAYKHNNGKTTQDHAFIH